MAALMSENESGWVRERQKGGKKMEKGRDLASHPGPVSLSVRRWLCTPAAFPIFYLTVCQSVIPSHPLHRLCVCLLSSPSHSS